MLTYSPVVRDLISDDRLQPLGAGTPNEAAREKLGALTFNTLTAPKIIQNLSAATACVAGLWLRHDFLDESHKISQDVHTQEGSYWHGIMHRREPDYSNAAYWFRKVGEHPIFDELAAAVRRIPDAIKTPSPWDPFWFIDYCETVSKKKKPDKFARLVQEQEWRLLFDYCYRLAVAGS